LEINVELTPIVLAKKNTFSKVLDLIEDIGRRDWTRTNDPHHVKVLFAVKSKCMDDYKEVN
jgi:hypothetical protein